MIVPNGIVQAERLVSPAPAVAGPLVFFNDDRRHLELAQPGSEGDATLTATNDDAIRLPRVAEFRRLCMALFLPCPSITIGTVLDAHWTLEAKRFLVPLEFAHGRQQRPDQTALQANVAEAASDFGIELNPTFNNPVGFGSALTVGNSPVRRLRCRQARLEHVANLVLTLHRLDVPGEGHEVPPIAIRLKEIDGTLHVSSGQRLVQRIEQIGNLPVRGFVEHDDVLPYAMIGTFARFIALSNADGGERTSR